VREELDLDERMFVCFDCGYVTDRDYNAAKVLAASA
jgi:transposase